MRQLYLKYRYPLLAGFSLYFAFGCYLAFVYGFYGSEGLFIYEKTFLAVFGSPPKMEKFGLIYPTFVFLINLPFAIFRHPITSVMLSAFAGGLSLISIQHLLKGTSINTGVQTTFLFLVAINPLSLYTFSTGTPTAWATLLLIGGLVSILKYSTEKLTIYLLITGILWGALTLIRFEMGLLLIMFVPLVPFIYYNKNTEEGIHARFSVFLMVATPAVFAVAGWMYVNWIFSGDPLNFLHDSQAYLRIPGLLDKNNTALFDVRENVFYSISYIAKYAIIAVPLLVYAVLRAGFNTGLLILSFVMMFGLILHLGVYKFTAEDLTLIFFLAVAIVVSPLDQKKWHQFVTGILLIASLGGSLYVMRTIGSPDEKYLANWDLDISTSTQTLSKILADKIADKPGYILLDDTELFSFVLQVKDTDRMVLPYQSERFAESLLTPSEMITYIIITDPSYQNARMDALNLAFPNHMQNGIPGYAILDTVGPWRLYKLIEVAPRFQAAAGMP